MKFNIKFSPEKRKDKAGSLISDNVPLLADIRFAGKRFFYFTGYRINVDWQDSKRGAWDFTKEELKKNNIAKEGKQAVAYNLVNKRLTLIQAKSQQLFEGNPSITEIRQAFDIVCNKSNVVETKQQEFYPMFDTYVRDSSLSHSRKKNIKTVILHWKDFNNSITFNEVTAETLKSFEKFLLADTKSPKGTNTVNYILKITRAFWNYCRNRFRDEGKALHYPFENYSIPSEVYGNPIYITSQERDVLLNAKLETEKLQRIRDIFVFQCLVGARVGDLCKLTKANIQDGVLTYIPRKTKEDKPVTVSIPLHQKAKDILERYNFPDGRLMPFISDQRYNEYIKDLFEEAELTRTVTRLNPRTRIEEQVRLCDIASSHMARRAFVGNLFGKVDNAIIGSMSGHVPGSKAFARYYDVSKELQLDAINKL